jgi:hypothetical protein
LTEAIVFPGIKLFFKKNSKKTVTFSIFLYILEEYTLARIMANMMTNILARGVLARAE